MKEASRAQGSVEEARFALERIAEVDPKPGEYEELEELLPRSEHAEVLVATANEAHESLAAEGGALDAVNSAVAGAFPYGDRRPQAGRHRRCPFGCLYLA
ncbi:MAG: hypothetical protein ACLS3M_03600 [Collinsella sp.]